MKTLFFDTGPIISLTTNNLLWLLPKLKEAFNGEFAITDGVRFELVQKPLETKKFKFEALQVQGMIEQRVLDVMTSPAIRQKALYLQNLANRIFIIRRQPMQILQQGECETLAAALLSNVGIIVCDERITRTLLEAPHQLQELYERRLHEKVQVDDRALHEFSKAVAGIKVIRSVELVLIAYEKGFLDQYLVKVPNVRRELLDSLLWGVKLHGAAISEEEIAELVKNELKR
jgi:predicted nucleic acid-binding protein